jgi:hypothetical protein
LRSEEVISYPYDDFESATPTPFGRRVLNWNRLDTAPSGDQELRASRLPESVLELPTDTEGMQSIELSEPGDSRNLEIKLTREGGYIQLKISKSGTLQIETLESSEQVDPLIGLYDLQSRELLDVNDDGQGYSLEWKISRSVQPGQLIVRSQSITGEGNSTLRVQLLNYGHNAAEQQAQNRGEDAAD